MARKSALFRIGGGVLIVGGIFFLLDMKIFVLQLQNTDHPQTLSIRIRPFERFSLYYIHSIHRQPVIEEFEAAPNMIILKGVRTNSPALAEQYGFDDTRTFHPMNEKLGAIFLRVAEGEGQGLIIRDRKIYLSEIGARGDRIQLGVKSVSVGSYLFAMFSESLRI